MKTTKELVAKLIFSTSELRFFEKELSNDHNNRELSDIVIKCQVRVDDILKQMGMTEFIPMKQLIEILSIDQ